MVESRCLDILGTQCLRVRSVRSRWCKVQIASMKSKLNLKWTAKDTGMKDSLHKRIRGEGDGDGDGEGEGEGKGSGVWSL